MISKDSSRRDFIKTSAGAVATASAVASVASAKSDRDANSKIRIGFIGPGGRGFGAHVKKLAKLENDGQPIELVGVCDVYNKHRDRAATYIRDKTGVEPKKFEDYREMIEKGDLDAVCILSLIHI